MTRNSCGTLIFLSDRIISSLTSAPKFSDCFKKGNISLPVLPDAPFKLQNLLNGLVRTRKSVPPNICTQKLTLNGFDEP